MEEDWLVQQQIVDVAVDHSQRELTSHAVFRFLLQPTMTSCTKRPWAL